MLKPLYGDDLPLWEKIKTIAKEIYRADDAVADTSVRNQLREFEAQAAANSPSAWPRRNTPSRPIPILKARRATMSCPSARCGSLPAPSSSSRSAAMS